VLARRCLFSTVSIDHADRPGRSFDSDHDDKASKPGTAPRVTTPSTTPRGSNHGGAPGPASTCGTPSLKAGHHWHPDGSERTNSSTRLSSTCGHEALQPATGAGSSLRSPSHGPPVKLGTPLSSGLTLSQVWRSEHWQQCTPTAASTKGQPGASARLGQPLQVGPLGLAALAPNDSAAEANPEPDVQALSLAILMEYGAAPAATSPLAAVPPAVVMTTRPQSAAAPLVKPVAALPSSAVGATTAHGEASASRCITEGPGTQSRPGASVGLGLGPVSLDGQTVTVPLGPALKVAVAGQPQVGSGDHTQAEQPEAALARRQVDDRPASSPSTATSKPGSDLESSVTGKLGARGSADSKASGCARCATYQHVAQVRLEARVAPVRCGSQPDPRASGCAVEALTGCESELLAGAGTASVETPAAIVLPTSVCSCNWPLIPGAPAGYVPVPVLT
jgi:hypothetical protein